jgi:glucose/arabinose dehydrogenase
MPRRFSHTPAHGIGEGGEGECCAPLPTLNVCRGFKQARRDLSSACRALVWTAGFPDEYKRECLEEKTMTRRWLTILLGSAVLVTASATASFAPPSNAPLPPGAMTPTNIPSGNPEGVGRLQNHNSSGFPAPQSVEGQPLETRAPELASDHPLLPGQTRAPYKKSVPYKVTSITEKLDHPWSLAFLPDGKMLVTQKDLGTMVVVDQNGAISQPVAGVPASAAQGQMGLLEVMLDPKFASNHRIFFSYSEAVHDLGSPIENTQIVLARATFDQAANALSDVKAIFRVKPSLPRRLSANAGGKIAIGRDGNIFMTVGDRSASPPWDVAQHLDTDLGKIIHVTPDGAPVKGNPFIATTGALPEIWSLGHRSQESLTIDPKTGELWEAEDGPRGGDKLLNIKPGKNYGWPVYVHGVDYPGEEINGGHVEAAGMEQPLYYWDPVIAPSGMAFYQGKLFAAWKNSLFIGSLRGKMLDRLEMQGGKVVGEEELLTDQGGRVRDVRVGPDGAVYVVTDEGKLMKLTPG